MAPQKKQSWFLGAGAGCSVRMKVFKLHPIWNHFNRAGFAYFIINYITIIGSADHFRLQRLATAFSNRTSLA